MSECSLDWLKVGDESLYNLREDITSVHYCKEICFLRNGKASGLGDKGDFCQLKKERSHEDAIYTEDEDEIGTLQQRPFYHRENLHEKIYFSWLSFFFFIL